MKDYELRKFRKDVLEKYWTDYAEKGLLCSERWEKYFSDILPEELKNSKGVSRQYYEKDVDYYRTFISNLLLQEKRMSENG